MVKYAVVMVLEVCFDIKEFVRVYLCSIAQKVVSYQLFVVAKSTKIALEPQTGNLACRQTGL